MKKNDTIVLLKEVWKVYKLGKVEYPALRGVNLKVCKGEFISVVGPSGSGKSTMLNLIGALDRPTRGKVYVDGVDLSNLSDDALAEVRRHKIGFVFQTFNLIPRLTALQNVEVPMISAGVAAEKRREKARKLLESVGLKGLENHRPTELSGGEQQRVAIARALANNPSLILADEPTGNLDSKTAWTIISLLKDLNEAEKVTVILVTHNEDLTKVSDKIFHLRDGKIVKEEVVGNEEN